MDIHFSVSRREEYQDATGHIIRVLWLKPSGSTSTEAVKVYVNEQSFKDSLLGAKYEVRRMPEK